MSSSSGALGSRLKFLKDISSAGYLKRWLLHLASDLNMSPIRVFFANFYAFSQKILLLHLPFIVGLIKSLLNFENPFFEVFMVVLW